MAADHDFFSEDQPRYRGERRDSNVPLFREWREWQGAIEPGTSGPSPCRWRSPGC